ncbi:MAG: hypothetical protein Q4A17_08295 [Thermoguttaceae bacterium]|nr:hypothetical protein [Thermoguttaceae bacterium]
MDNYIKVAQAIIKEARMRPVAHQLIKKSETKQPDTKTDKDKKAPKKESHEVTTKPIVPETLLDRMLWFLNWGGKWEPNVSQKKSRAQYMKTHPDE